MPGAAAHGLLWVAGSVPTATPDPTPVAIWPLLLVFVVGLLGIVVPVLPGLIICLGAVLVWALEVGGTRAWVTFAVAAAVFLVGVVLQYAIPGRRMKAEGVGRATIAVGLVAAVVGFFVVPVVGAPLFFVLGIYLLERFRYRDPRRAAAATRSAVKGVIRSIGVELATALSIAVVWALGVASHSL
ncbi:hypothetical protein GCM10022199_17560 [Marihabitans asiaticum]|uniref:DUF456 domain-containing protein n=1 Tax=Marihabitans asiaticum TaxID=415218 RepID=A0A560W6V7_9MICO|nr:DUF456 domain-containing protein [Marihabitans asiaticum]TWD13361.1 hypothetical protein FB557_2762 [Marihabitans asiaticum]